MGGRGIRVDSEGGVSIQDLEIRPLDIRDASPEEYAGFNDLENAIRAEVIPEDPPVPCEEEAARWRAMPDFFKEGAWAAWEPGNRRMVGLAAVDAEYTGDNMHLADFAVEVLPEYRGRGLGRKLLGYIPSFARTHNRRLLAAQTNERVPAGGDFMRRIGGRVGFEARDSQLILADVDRSLIAAWMSRAGSLHQDFRLQLWEGPVPEEYLRSYTAVIQELINDAPHDALELEDSTHVDKTFRPFEAWEVAGGRSRWTLVAIHRADDRVVGMTDVVWSPERPGVIEQHGTGTARAFRNRGIGRWMKATMLDKILSELPRARVIRTGNAGSNAPMLKINVELGYKPFIARTIWQVETEAVEKYLARPKADPG